jgi:uncharacterized protein YbaR (Trm112 family)
MNRDHFSMKENNEQLSLNDWQNIISLLRCPVTHEPLRDSIHNGNSVLVNQSESQHYFFEDGLLIMLKK